MNEQAVLPLVNLLREVLTGFCKYPAELTVRAESCPVTEGKINVVVHPHIMDYPRMIGKDGRMVKAFKAITKAVGEKSGAVVEFILKDSPKKGHKEDLLKVPVNPGYDLKVPARAMEKFIGMMDTEVTAVIAESCGDVKKFVVHRKTTAPEIDHEFLTHLRTIFAGFGRFQGIGDINIEVVQPTRGGSGVEGRPRRVLCASKNGSGAVSC